MSVKIMSYVWEVPLFKGSDKLVMLCLADFSNDEGCCWPSIETISRKSGISVSTVKSSIKNLVNANWLIKKNQFKKVEGKSVRASNQYALPVQRLKRESDKHNDLLYGTQSQQPDSERSDLERSDSEQSGFDQGVGQNPAGGRAKSDYKPSLDPSVDPPIDPPKSPKGIPYEKIVDCYNEILGRRFTYCKQLSEERKRKIKRLWKELPDKCIEEVKIYFTEFERLAGDFYTGKNDRGWKADFGYLMRPDVLVRTREGNLGGSGNEIMNSQDIVSPSEEFRQHLRQQGRPANF